MTTPANTDAVARRPQGTLSAHVAQTAAVAAVGLAWGLDTIPLAPVIAVAAVAAFSVVAVRGPVKPAMVIGLQQMAIGIGVVVITAVAVLA